MSVWCQCETVFILYWTGFVRGGYGHHWLTHSRTDRKPYIMFTTWSTMLFFLCSWVLWDLETISRFPKGQKGREMLVYTEKIFIVESMSSYYFLSGITIILFNRPYKIFKYFICFLFNKPYKIFPSSKLCF